MEGRAAFRDAGLDRFWRFVAERQRVWHRRVVGGEPPPWTDDEVLRRRRFTNVYRVLDPGTQYAIREVLARAETKPDRLFNVLLYRLVGRAETHAHVGFPRLETFTPGSSRRRFRPGEGRSAEGLREVYEGYPISVEPGDYVVADAG